MSLKNVAAATSSAVDVERLNSDQLKKPDGNLKDAFVELMASRAHSETLAERTHYPPDYQQNKVSFSAAGSGEGLLITEWAPSGVRGREVATAVYNHLGTKIDPKQLPELLAARRAAKTN